MTTLDFLNKKKVPFTKTLLSSLVSVCTCKRVCFGDKQRYILYCTWQCEKNNVCLHYSNVCVTCCYGCIHLSAGYPAMCVYRVLFQLSPSTLYYLVQRLLFVLSLHCKGLFLIHMMCLCMQTCL